MCAVSTDLTKVLGTYGSIYAAYKGLGIEQNSGKRNFGLKRVCRTANNGDCYLTCHPDSITLFRKGAPASLPVQVHDLQTNIITRYPSVTAAERDTNIHHDFINKHLNKGIYQREDSRRYKFSR